jgi:hypothetical protein
MPGQLALPASLQMRASAGGSALCAPRLPFSTLTMFELVGTAEVRAAWGRAAQCTARYRGVRMTSWFAKFADCRMAFVWVVAIAIAAAIYFLPIARLLDSLAE